MHIVSVVVVCVKLGEAEDSLFDVFLARGKLFAFNCRWGRFRSVVFQSVVQTAPIFEFCFLFSMWMGPPVVWHDEAFVRSFRRAVFIDVRSCGAVLAFMGPHLVFVGVVPLELFVAHEPLARKEFTGEPMGEFLESINGGGNCLRIPICFASLMSGF